MLPDQNSVKAYHVYTYTFLDDLSCVRSPYDHFQYEERYRVDDAIKLIGDRFTEIGWEGDGTIGIIWLPPFVDVGIEDTHGTYIWHVKQMNNGTSFLACDVPLIFSRIVEQNLDFAPRETAPEMVPITIVETEVDWFTDAVNKIRTEMEASQSFLSAHPSADADNILRHLLFHYQNALVRLFNEFLDECYLQVLIEAIDSGNPHRIKLRKTRVAVDATSYVPEPDDAEDAATIADASSWFTIKGLISDMWKTYKWEPFKTKAEMLFKSLDYFPDDASFFEIRKHVVIRNCMHHHEARLDRDSLKSLGRDRLAIRDGGGMAMIEVWKPIVMTIEELRNLVTIMITFAKAFGGHVAKRIPTRHYRSKNPTTPSTPTN